MTTLQEALKEFVGPRPRSARLDVCWMKLWVRAGKHLFASLLKYVASCVGTYAPHEVFRHCSNDTLQLGLKAIFNALTDKIQNLCRIRR